MLLGKFCRFSLLLSFVNFRHIREHVSHVRPSASRNAKRKVSRPISYGLSYVPSSSYGHFMHRKVDILISGWLGLEI